MARTSAQAIQVRPVAAQQDNDMQQLTQTLLYRQNIERQKAEQQLAEARFLRDSIKQQQDAKNLIFGNSVKSLETYFNAADNVPASVTNDVLQNGIASLSGSINDPDFMSKAAVVVAQANSQLKGWQKYFKSTEDTVKELTEQYGMDASAVRQFAEKNMYQYGEVQPGVVDIVGLKDPSQFGDVASVLKQEVLSHPDLYQDSRVITDKAIKEIQKMSKDTEAQTRLAGALDKTGRFKVSLDSEYKSDKFDTQIAMNDPITGKSYVTAALDTKKFKDPRYARVDGDYYDALSEDKFSSLVKTASPIVKQRLHTGAIEAIRNHNAQAFQAAGYNPSLAYTISDKNIDQFWGVKGFINPYDDSAIDAFQRMYAVDLIKNSTGRYNENNTVRDSKVVTSADATAGRSGGSGGSGGYGGGTGEYVDQYSILLGNIKDKKSLTKAKYAQANTMDRTSAEYVSGVLKEAVGSHINESQYQYEILDNGQPGIIASKDIYVKQSVPGSKLTGGKPQEEIKLLFKKGSVMTVIDMSSINSWRNKTFGNKSELAATRGGNLFEQ